MQWYHWVMIAVIVIHVVVLVKMVRDDFKEED